MMLRKGLISKTPATTALMGCVEPQKSAASIVDLHRLRSQ